MASARDEMLRAISSHPLDDCAATDAALSVARAHRDALAESLDDEARGYETRAAGSDDLDTRIRLDVRARTLRNAAARVRALFGEQPK